MQSSILDSKEYALDRGYHRRLVLDLADPLEGKAFSMRVHWLATRFGLKRQCELIITLFDKSASPGQNKWVFRKLYPWSASFEKEAPDWELRLGQELLLTKTGFQGKLTGIAGELSWNFTWDPESSSHALSLPGFLSRIGLSRSGRARDCRDLIGSGWAQIANERFKFEQAGGVQSSWEGERLEDSWIWSHCNQFVDDRGDFQAMTFEAWTIRSSIGPWKAPSFSSCYLQYQGQSLVWNSLRDSYSLVSLANDHGWTFRADRGSLSFRGELVSRHQDFIGLAMEDTDGSLRFGVQSKLSPLKIQVYRNGKLEASLDSQNGATYEYVAGTPNPYVPTRPC